MNKYFIEFKKRYICKETIAIIVAIVLFAVMLCSILPEIPDETYILAPLIFVDDACYVGNKYVYEEDEIPSQKKFLGLIQSIVSSHERPSEHLQANRDIRGAVVYQSGDLLYVLIKEGEWCIYRKC